MTDEELKALVASLAVAQRLTDEQMKRNDKMLTEKLDRMGISLGNVTNNQGDVAEEFFFNSLANDTHLGSIHFDDIEKNGHKRRGKTEEEYDIIMTNGDALGIVEVKYKAHEPLAKLPTGKNQWGQTRLIFDKLPNSTLDFNS